MPETQKLIPMIGVDKLHYAKVTADTTETYTAGTPIAIPGLTEAGFNMNGQSSTFYADNGVYDTAVGNGEFDIAISCADLSGSLKADLFGFEYDDTTGEMVAGEIKSPDVAIQYRVQRSNGAYRYVTIYKAKAMPNEENVQTKGGSINFQTNGFSMKGAMRLKDGRLMRTLDDDDPNLPEGVTPAIIESKWFTDVDWEISPTA